MGEQADLMVDGTFCQECGVLLDGTSPGYPRSCKSCGGDVDEYEPEDKDDGHQNP